MERQALMERFLAVFGVERIAVLLADRDFVGEAWLHRPRQKLFIIDNSISLR